MQKDNARVSREPQRAEEVERLRLMQLHLNNDWEPASYIKQTTISSLWELTEQLS